MVFQLRPLSCLAARILRVNLSRVICVLPCRLDPPWQQCLCQSHAMSLQLKVVPKIGVLENTTNQQRNSSFRLSSPSLAGWLDAGLFAQCAVRIRRLSDDAYRLWLYRRKRRTLRAPVTLTRVGDGSWGMAAKPRARAIRAGVPRERDRREGIAEPDGRGPEGSRRHSCRAPPTAARRDCRTRRRGVRRGGIPRCTGAS